MDPKNLQGARVVGRQVVRQHSDAKSTAAPPSPEAQGQVPGNMPSSTRCKPRELMEHEPMELLKEKLFWERKAREEVEQTLELAGLAGFCRAWPPDTTFLFFL